MEALALSSSRMEPCETFAQNRPLAGPCLSRRAHGRNPGSHPMSRPVVTGSLQGGERSSSLWETWPRKARATGQLDVGERVWITIDGLSEGRPHLTGALSSQLTACRSCQTFLMLARPGHDRAYM